MLHSALLFTVIGLSCQCSVFRDQISVIRCMSPVVNFMKESQVNRVVPGGSVGTGIGRIPAESLPRVCR